MSQESNGARRAAQQYLDRGWAVVPIPSKSKTPIVKGWQSLRIKSDELERQFRPQSNVGVLLGEPSGWLVDVDLDHIDAIALADIYLPPTDAIFGRKSKQKSHRLYVVRGPISTLKRQHKQLSMIVELRSTGCQTVFPGSIHPSGEPVEWQTDGSPQVVDADDLIAAVNALADEVERRNGVRTARHPVSGASRAGSSAVVGRARRYLAKLSPAVSGDGGHNATYHAACLLVLGFNLDRQQALDLLGNWNQSCQPPWSEKELQHKVDDALKEPGQRGYLLNAGVAARVQRAARAAAPTLQEVVSPQPFPVSVLPGAVGKFVCEAAAAIGCNPSFVALPTLACLARAIGNKRTIRLKRTWAEPAILWCAIVGKSGTHKSPALSAAVAELQRRQTAAIADYDEAVQTYDRQRAEYDRDLSVWRRDKESRSKSPPEAPKTPHLERYIVSDITIEALADRLHHQFDGVLVVRDELAGWLGGIAEYKGGQGSDLGHWLASWSALPLTVDRKTGAIKTVHVPRAAVSIVGGIQPGVLRTAIGREHLQDGLCARLLLAMPEPKPIRWTEATVSADTEAALAKTFDGFFALESAADEDGKPAPFALPLTPEAKTAWVDYYNRHRAELSDLDDDLAAAWSKLEAYAARFALIFQLCANAAGEANDDAVDEESIRAGIALADWFGNEAKRVYGILAETEQDREERELVELIRRKGGAVTARDLMRSSRRYAVSDDADAALDSLVKAQRGRWEPVPTGMAGGHPTRRFRLVDDTVDADTTTTNPAENDGSVNVNTVGNENGRAGLDHINRLLPKPPKTTGKDDEPCV